MDEEIESMEMRLRKVTELKQATMQALLTGRIRLLDGIKSERLELVHSG